MPALNNICVIGLGYIGLPTATVFADNGVEVLGVDIKQEAVDAINSGKPHIIEPDLDVLLRKVLAAGKFKAATKPAPADAFIIAVPTPFKNQFEPDTSYIEAAAKAIAPVLKPGNLVVLESTSPVGTSEQLSVWLAAARPDLTFPHQDLEDTEPQIRIAHCPERVLPGRILHEVVHNARVVGGITRECAHAAVRLYRTISRAECHVTNARTAELVKLSENAFRDVNIAYANELSTICDKLKIDVWELIRLANLHPRVNILKPGPGVGGHCIAVDPWFIIAADPEGSKLIRAAREVNNGKPHFVVDKVKEAAAAIDGADIACLGLAYKADIDDIRESPAIEIVEELHKQNVGRLLIVEPHIDKLPPALAKNGNVLTDFNTALRKADIVLLLVDHKEFLKVGRDVLRDKIVIDTRGVW
jgi:UDP-N-acetyl-D-mannosaminuronic acid dehydrogenase